jgi:hypothetical protein
MCDGICDCLHITDTERKCNFLTYSKAQFRIKQEDICTQKVYRQGKSKPSLSEHVRNSPTLKENFETYAPSPVQQQV